MASRSRIVALGAYAPEKVLSNADFEKTIDTSDEWIVQRTGMRERRIASETEFSSDLAIKAVENLVSESGACVDDVDQIIVTTFTPDHYSPHVSSIVQAHFGMKGTGTFDLNAACTGFAYAMMVADSLISSGANRKVLVIAAETVSKVVNYADRTTCILFGDAAVACLLEYTDGPGAVLASRFKTNGTLGDNVTCGNFSNSVLGHELGTPGKVEQNGQRVYKYVMQKVPKGLVRLLEKADLTLDDLDWFIPHSANMRMIQTVCEKLPFPESQTLTSLEFYGNTSSASIPLALWLGLREGRVKRGDLLALYGFGAGLTHGGVIVRY